MASWKEENMLLRESRRLKEEEELKDTKGFKNYKDYDRYLWNHGERNNWKTKDLYKYVTFVAKIHRVIYDSDSPNAKVLEDKDFVSPTFAGGSSKAHNYVFDKFVINPKEGYNTYTLTKDGRIVDVNTHEGFDVDTDSIYVCTFGRYSELPLS